MGINYSGFHDTSVAITDWDGCLLFATSLERISRNKQDGRPPIALLNLIEKYSVSEIATSTKEFESNEPPTPSQLFKTTLPTTRETNFRHADEFYEFYNSLNLPVTFVEHQESHAYSAIGWSGFKQGISMTYDGGMCNSSLFGSLARFNQRNEYNIIDGFDYRLYPKITTLYSLVTAILGFTPNKHEGKITGLAAKGKPSNQIYQTLEKWFANEFYRIESFAKWEFPYSKGNSPILFPNYGLLDELKYELEPFLPEDLAATIQAFTELHILDLLQTAIKLGLISGKENICLSGGLFANVRLNQKIASMGFNDIFIAPAMTDDGTALGAAWKLSYKTGNFKLRNGLITSFHGNSFSRPEILSELNKLEIKFTSPKKIVALIAEKLASGDVVGIYSGKSEFGPRALGNRSLLASPKNYHINEILNRKLHRTEFMPFAPVLRDKDFKKSFETKLNSSFSYMTITAQAKKYFVDLCPAVVHIDGSARPQIISPDQNELIYDILSEFYSLTGIPALINTSFNVHEEPIVDSPEDAIKSFLIAQIDWLLFEGEYLASYKENRHAALEVLINDLGGSKRKKSQELIESLSRKIWWQQCALEAKERVIQDMLKNQLGNNEEGSRLPIDTIENLAEYLD